MFDKVLNTTTSINLFKSCGWHLQNNSIFPLGFKLLPRVVLFPLLLTLIFDDVADNYLSNHLSQLLGNVHGSSYFAFSMCLVLEWCKSKSDPWQTLVNRKLFIITSFTSWPINTIWSLHVKLSWLLRF